MNVKRFDRVPIIEYDKDYISVKCPICRNEIGLSVLEFTSTCPYCKMHINKYAKVLEDFYYKYSKKLYNEYIDYMERRR